MLSWIIIPVAYLLLSIYRAVRGHFREKSFRSFARAYNDQVAPTEPSQPPWSLWRRKVAMGREGAGILDSFIARKYQLYGYTHQQISYFLGRQKGVCTSDPENFQAVYVTNFDDWQRAQLRDKVARPFLQPGIFTTDGPVWHRQKEMLKPQFRREKILKNHILMEKHLQVLLRAIGPVESGKWTRSTELLGLLDRFTVDSISEFMFGTSASTLAAVSQPPVALTDAQKAFQGFEGSLGIAKKYFSTRSRLGKSYWLYDSLEYRRAVKNLYDAVNPFIRDVLDKADDKKDELSRNIIESLAALGCGEEEIANQCMHIFISGTIASAAALGFTLGLLERHPHVFAKLRAEILNTFGTEDEPKQEMTGESIKTVNYLQWVVQETLRLYPAAAQDSRIAIRDTVLPVGGGIDGSQPMAVKKGARIQLCTYYMHRRPDYWGEDANSFRPERWETKKKGGEFLPFGGGPQMCVGHQYAMNQVAYIIARFAQLFKGLEKPEGQDNLEKDWNIVLHPKSGVVLKLQAA
ncbi:hypothetical protein ABW20_dc0106159 [Dactylellina cionopaga]|nr:hypothetical protein ABW20_dc0106159 [Dactylellina cionopaga]